jgi:hypothetical protein
MEYDTCDHQALLAKLTLQSLMKSLDRVPSLAQVFEHIRQEAFHFQNSFTQIHELMDKQITKKQVR